MLHTRVILRGYNPGDLFIRETVDFGIDFQRDHSKVKEHPRVKPRLEAMQKRYEKVSVEARDTN